MKVLVLFLGALLAASSAAVAAPPEPVKFEEVIGGGGVPLTALHWGNPDGQAILLVHAYSQSYVNYSKQMDDPELAKEFHMVSFDLRGHGQSAKPWTKEAYADTQMWADDVAAVIKAFGLKKPIIVGWSFGANVVMDYVRHYGVSNIGGIEIVGSLAGFGKRPPPETVGDAAKPRVSRLSPDTRANVAGMPGLVDMLTEKPLPPAERELFMMSNAMTPAYVRRLLLNHPWDNDDLIPTLKLPLLVLTGTKDTSVKAEYIIAMSKRLPGATLSLYEDLGPSPFYEDAPRFNKELTAFAHKAAKK